MTVIWGSCFCMKKICLNLQELWWLPWKQGRSQCRGTQPSGQSEWDPQEGEDPTDNTDIPTPNPYPQALNIQWYKNTFTHNGQMNTENRKHFHLKDETCTSFQMTPPLLNAHTKLFFCYWYHIPCIHLINTISNQLHLQPITCSLNKYF